MTANDQEGFNHIELKEGALEDGLFVGIGIGFVRSGWFITLFWGMPHVFYGWTGLDWVRWADLTT